MIQNRQLWSKVPGLVNTLDNEGEMDLMLARTEETISFTSVLVPTLSWDPATDREIIARPGRTWVEGAAGLMPREGNCSRSSGSWRVYASFRGFPSLKE